MAATQACPCGQSLDYRQCCFLLHAQLKTADSALQLMRARYSAFVLGHWDFVFDSWHHSTRPVRDSLQSDKHIKWISLQVVDHHNQVDDATVEFIARYKYNGKAQTLHEKSRFLRDQAQWFYVDGDLY